MGSKATRVKRKKPTNSKMRSERKIGISNVPGVPPPPPPSSFQKPIEPILRELKKLDINKLPRDKKAIEELDEALSDANHNLYIKEDDRISLYSNLDISLVKSEIIEVEDANALYATVEHEIKDPDIEFLAKEVERRAKLKDDLDKKIRSNEKILKIQHNEPINKEKDQTKLPTSISLNTVDIKSNIDKFIEDQDDHFGDSDENNFDDELYFKKIKLKRELLMLNEIENEQRLKILEQERELVVQNMKLQDALVLNESIVNIEHFNTGVINDEAKQTLNQEISVRFEQNNNDETETSRIIRDLSDVKPPNKDLKRYLSMVTKYQVTPDKKFVPIEQYIQNNEMNNLSSESRDSSSFGLDDSYLNHPAELIIKNSKSFLYSDSEESTKNSPIKTKEKEQVNIKNPGVLNLSSHDLQNIAILIEEQENEARKKGVKRQSSYYFNGLKLYPNGLIENLIKKQNSAEENDKKVEDMIVDKYKNDNDNNKLNQNENMNHQFHESESSLYNKNKTDLNNDKNSKSSSSFDSFKSENTSSSRKSDSFSMEKLLNTENKIYSRIDSKPKLSINDITHVRKIAHNLRQIDNDFVQVSPINSARPTIKNNYINQKSDRNNNVYTSIEEKLNYKILSKKDLVKVDWDDINQDDSYQTKKRISNNSENSFMSRLKNEIPYVTPKRNRKNLPKRYASLADGLVKVKQIDPILLNKSRIKSKRNSSFLNKLLP